MGLNRSNAPIAPELGLNPNEVQRMTEPRREGIVARQPDPVRSGAGEGDEVSVVAGHQGFPDAVKKKAVGGGGAG